MHATLGQLVGENPYIKKYYAYTADISIYVSYIHIPSNQTPKLHIFSTVTCLCGTI